MPGRSAVTISRSGFALVSSRQKAISSSHGVAPGGPVRGRGHLDRDPVREVDPLGGLAGDESGEQRDREQGPDVAEDHARLAPVGGDEHHGAALAGGEDARVVLEGGEEDGHQGRDPGLAAPAAHDEPRLPRRPGRRLGAAGALLIELELAGRHGEPEDRLEDHAPGAPARARELAPEEVGVAQGLENVHALYPRPPRHGGEPPSGGRVLSVARR
jgi:hypothetical protein